jgi:methionine synthase I (cobalamin-dependent)
MKIQVVNNQALGQATTMPGMRLGGVPATRAVRQKTLGQMGPTIGSEELAYRAAMANLEGIKKAFPKLVALLGEKTANKALAEAEASTEKAQAAFARQMPRK